MATLARETGRQTNLEAARDDVQTGSHTTFLVRRVGNLPFRQEECSTRRGTPPSLVFYTSNVGRSTMRR